MPQDIPEYRKARPHTDFVTNIPIDPQVFKEHLAQLFSCISICKPQRTKNLHCLKNFRYLMIFYIDLLI